MKILAVDDDPDICAILPMMIELIGFPRVTVVRSGAAALAEIESATQDFRCFLLDINMPGMDGIELCGRIRTIQGYDRTPIIMLTAMHDTSYVERAQAAGATDYVTKPFDLPLLSERLKSALSTID